MRGFACFPPLERSDFPSEGSLEQNLESLKFNSSSLEDPSWISLCAGNFGWVTQALGHSLAKQSQDFAFFSTGPCFCLLKYKIFWVWKMQSWIVPLSNTVFSTSVCGRTSQEHPSSILQREKLWLYPTCCFWWDKQWFPGKIPACIKLCLISPLASFSRPQPSSAQGGCALTDTCWRERYRKGSGNV